MTNSYAHGGHASHLLREKSTRLQTYLYTAFYICLVFTIIASGLFFYIKRRSNKAEKTHSSIVNGIDKNKRKRIKNKKKRKNDEDRNGNCENTNVLNKSPGKNIRLERKTLVVAMPIGRSIIDPQSLDDRCFVCEHLGGNCSVNKNKGNKDDGERFKEAFDKTGKMNSIEEPPIKSVKIV